MEITKRFLKQKKACKDGYDWFLEQKTTDANIIFDRLIKENQLDWLNWIVTRLMTKEECIKYAIYAAEKVLHIFEEKYPDDKRPRKAIAAAKRYLKDPSEENRKKADAAYNAAAYAGANAYAYKKLKLKICKYGIKLLNGRVK